MTPKTRGHKWTQMGFEQLTSKAEVIVHWSTTRKNTEQQWFAQTKLLLVLRKKAALCLQSAKDCNDLIYLICEIWQGLSQQVSVLTQSPWLYAPSSLCLLSFRSSLINEAARAPKSL